MPISGLFVSFVSMAEMGRYVAENVPSGFSVSVARKPEEMQDKQDPLSQVACDIPAPAASKCPGGARRIAVGAEFPEWV